MSVTSDVGKAGAVVRKLLIDKISVQLYICYYLRGKSYLAFPTRWGSEGVFHESPPGERIVRGFGDT